jgi:hypothetical protein
MEPSRDGEAVVDLLDVILDDGAVVQADVVVTVADVPLIGVSLRAAIAGMTTMTEYGHFEDWEVDEDQSARDANPPTFGVSNKERYGVESDVDSSDE